MSRSQLIENTLKTLLFAIGVVSFFIAYIPYKIVTAENHTVLAWIGRWRFAGYIFIGSGIIGYVICFWHFIVDAKGSPIPGDTQQLIVRGLYRYVRNPIYISACLIFVGEALLFQSLAMVYYFFGGVAVFHGFVVFVEEPFLHGKFGDTYERYCKSVNRWIPRLKAPRKNE